MPVWGTCLGFELLVLSFTKKEVRSKFSGENHLGTIILSPNHASSSRLLADLTGQKT